VGAADAAGFEDLGRQVEWLAGILDARGYPVERLARDLEIRRRRHSAAPAAGRRCGRGARPHRPGVTRGERRVLSPLAGSGGEATQASLRRA